MDFVTIDFEASCLPRHGRSFPIEVGISGPEGSFSWLIRPHAIWRDWNWTDEAEALHGIRRETLDRDGLPVDIVMDQLKRAIGGRQVVADSTVDAYWWNTLAAAAGDDTIPPIEHIATVLDALGSTTHQILRAQDRADRLCPARHRAAADALWLRIVIENLQSLSMPPGWQMPPLPAAAVYWPASAAA